MDVTVSRAQPELRFFITNRPDVALVAEKYGVDHIWVDLEVRGKEQRQHNLNTVKSHHSISDIAAIPAESTQEEPATAEKRVVIVCDNGTVNIRVGNETKYARITAAESGTALPYVATAGNGWHAVIVGDKVGWVSGKYSKIE